MKKFLEEIAGSLNIPQVEVADLIGEDGTLKEDEALSKFKTALVQKIQAVTENQKGRFTKETHSFWEKILKDRAAGKNIPVDPELKGEALLDHLLGNLSQTSPSAANLDELTPEQLRKHKAFEAALGETITPFKAKISELENLITTEREGAKLRVNREQGLRVAFELLEAKKWKKGETEAEINQRVQTIKDLLELKTNGFKNLLVEDNKVFLTDGTDAVLTDEFRNPIDFGKFVESINVFGFHEFDPKSQTPGASGSAAQNNGRNVDLYQLPNNATAEQKAAALRQAAERLRQAK